MIRAWEGFLARGSVAVHALASLSLGATSDRHVDTLWAEARARKAAS